MKRKRRVIRAIKILSVETRVRRRTGELDTVVRFAIDDQEFIFSSARSLLWAWNAHDPGAVMIMEALSGAVDLHVVSEIMDD